MLLLAIIVISAAFDVRLQLHVPPSVAIGMTSSPYTIGVWRCTVTVQCTAAPVLILMWMVETLSSALYAFRPY